MVAVMVAVGGAKRCSIANAASAAYVLRIATPVRIRVVSHKLLPGDSDTPAEEEV